MDIIEAVLYFLKDATAVISLIMIMRYIFLCKTDFGKLKPALLAAVTVLNSAVGIFVLTKSVPDGAEIMDFISNVIFIAAVRLLTSEKKIIKIIWIVMLYIMTADMLFSLVSSYLGAEIYIECITNIIIFVFVSLCIHFFAAKSNFNLLPKVFDEIPKWVFIDVMIFDLSCYYKEFGVSDDWYKMFYTISSVMVIGCVLYLFIRLFYMSYEQNRILGQIQLQNEHYRNTVSAQDDLRSFRHDYKNHMIVLNFYLENGELKKASDYLKTLNEDIDDALNNIYTGNFTADAVLSNKIITARSKGITIDFRGNGPESGIEPQEICMIFSNLIDNAIEACEKTKGDKTIGIKSGAQQKIFMLSISNPCADAPVRKNGKILTTKKDSKNHGIGLKNVKTTAEKYSGTLLTNYSDGIFTADVRLTLKDHAIN